MQCEATKPNGNRCSFKAQKGNTSCGMHIAEAKRRALEKDERCLTITYMPTNASTLTTIIAMPYNRRAQGDMRFIRGEWKLHVKELATGKEFWIPVHRIDKIRKHGAK